MRFGKSFIYVMIPLFSDITAAYCAFLLFTAVSKTGAMSFSFPFYFLFACLAALVNCLLCQKDRSLTAVALPNAAIAIATEIAMFCLPNSIHGLSGYGFSAAFFLLPTLRSFYLSRHPVTIDTMQRYCEISVLGVGFFLFAQTGFFEPETSVNLLCVLAVLLNLLTLSSLRMKSVARVKTGAGIQRGLILFAVIALMLAAAIGLGFFLPMTRDAAFSVLNAVKDFFLAILRLFERFIAFLVSLFPASELEEVELVPPESLSMDGDGDSSQLKIPQEAIVIMIAAACVAVVALLIYLLFRFRKLRLQSFTITGAVQKEKRDTSSLFSILLQWLRKLFNILAFYIRLLFSFNTYAGVFVRLELRCKKSGFRRSGSQTPREFLARLGENVSDGSDGVRSAFLYLADQIDMQCFSSERVPASRRMDRAQVKSLMRATKPSCLKAALSSSA